MMINKSSNDKFNFQADLVLAVPAALAQADLDSVVLGSGAGKAAFHSVLQELEGKAVSKGSSDLLDLLHLKFHSCSQ
jgi:hypothetical protein